MIFNKYIITLVAMSISCYTLAMPAKAEIQHVRNELRKTVLTIPGYGYTFSSEKKEYNGNNKYHTFVHDPRVYSIEGDANHVQFKLSDYRTANINIAAKYDDPLEVTMYKNARRYPQQGMSNPGLSSDSGLYCSGDYFGRFRVLQYEVDEENNPVKVAFDYEERCGRKSSPLIFGAVRFNSDLPMNSEPAVLKNNRLIIPFIRIDISSNQSREEVKYVSMILKRDSVNNNHFEVESIVPAVKGKKEILVPGGYDEDIDEMVVPSVIIQNEDNSLSEYEFGFDTNPKDLSEGSLLTLVRAEKLR